METNKQISQRVFNDIQVEFPHLHMEMFDDDPHVDLSMNIPQQEGVAFSVNADLQGDELTLHASDLTADWFPCDHPEMRERFVDAIKGLLSGKYRIRKEYRLGFLVKVILERPEGAAWKLIAWSAHNLAFLIPWRSQWKIIQNTQDTSATEQPH
jgi:hypothetical protein